MSKPKPIWLPGPTIWTRVCWPPKLLARFADAGHGDARLGLHHEQHHAERQPVRGKEPSAAPDRVCRHAAEASPLSHRRQIDDEPADDEENVHQLRPARPDAAAPRTTRPPRCTTPELIRTWKRTIPRIAKARYPSNTGTTGTPLGGPLVLARVRERQAARRCSVRRRALALPEIRHALASLAARFRAGGRAPMSVNPTTKAPTAP